MRVVLDTHILVYWCVKPEKLTASQQHVVRSIHADNPAIVADISLWEIAALNSTGRLRIDRPLLQWLHKATARPLVRVAEITANIADEVARMEGWTNRDPADRLIVATARIFGASLLTNDAMIRDSELVDVV